MRARPSLSLLLLSLLSCASPPAPSPSSPSVPAPSALTAPAPLSPVWGPDSAPHADSGPAPPPTPDENLTVRFSRPLVQSLVFLDARRFFLTNELGEFFRSTDAGETWASVPGPRVRRLSVANRSELWAASGWLSDEGPVGRVMRSTDGGQSWSILELEPEKLEGAAAMGRIPFEFVNHADEPPLLVMGDGAFVEPLGGRAFEQWPRLGTPGFPWSAKRAAVIAAAVDQRGTFYAAATEEPVVAMSRDRGKSWQQARLPATTGRIEKLACGGDACFALVNQAESDAIELFRASAGTKAWTLVKAFEARPFARVMVKSGAVPEVEEFFVCGFAATGEKVVFVGYGVPPDFMSQWPASFTLAADGTLASSTPINAGEPRHGIDHVCKLTRAPDGSLWAAGRGAFRFEGAEWKRRWKYPGAEERRE